MIARSTRSPSADLGVHLHRNTQIRALNHRRDVPIVMVTGTCVVDVVAAALSAGADDVLYKPVDVNLLVSTVSKCVEGRRPHDS